MLKIGIEGTLPTINSDLSSAMERLSAEMLAEVQNNFQTGGRGQWPVLKSGGRSQLIRSGNLYKSLQKRWGSDFAEVVNSESIPYAQIHQSGGVTHPSVTMKSKKFYWAKWYETGDEMWKRMALKAVGTTMNVSIPARPWMTLPPDFLDNAIERLRSKILSIETP